MSFDPPILIGLAVLAGAIAYLFITHKKSPPAPPVATPIFQSPPPVVNHAENALLSLEAAERQAAARRLDEMLGQHHLGQIATAMGLATTPTPPTPPAPPAPKA